MIHSDRDPVSHLNNPPLLPLATVLPDTQLRSGNFQAPSPLIKHLSICGVRPFIQLYRFRWMPLEYCEVFRAVQPMWERYSVYLGDIQKRFLRMHPLFILHILRQTGDTQTTKPLTHSDFLAKARDRQRFVGVIRTKERQLWQLPPFSGSLSTGETMDGSAGTSCMSPGFIVWVGDG